MSWLPSQILDRNTAITAMILADITAEEDLREGHRLWPHVPVIMFVVQLAVPVGPMVTTSRKTSCRRSNNGNWVLPGGAVEIGGSLTQAAVREIREKTRIECEVIGLSGIYTGPGHAMLSAAEVRAGVPPGSFPGFPALLR